MRIVVFLKCFCLCTQLCLKLGEFKSERMSYKEMAQRYWKIFKNEAVYTDRFVHGKDRNVKRNCQNDNKLRKSTLESTVIHKCR